MGAPSRSSTQARWRPVCDHAESSGRSLFHPASPRCSVRHLRDGVVENNRSKARLIEAVHQVVNRFEGHYYFPAYELVIDVLRDYRFYDIDLAHPNYAATRFVLDHFTRACIDEESRALMDEVKKLVTARKHRAFQPETTAHRDFMRLQLEKAVSLKEQYSFLDLDEEIRYFSRT